MTLQMQVADAVAEILVEAELLEPTGITAEGQLRLSLPAGFQFDREIAAKCIRAAYSLGYHHALTEAQPFPLTVASTAEREAWARLPVS